MEKTLGARIAEYRKEKGLKQDDLAEALGVSGQAVSKWENDISCPDIMLLPALADKLGVTVDELLRGEKSDSKAVFVPEGERKAADSMMLRMRFNSSDGDSVRINLPIPLIKVLIASGVSVASMGGEKMESFDINWESIMTLVEQGVMGKIMEIKTSDGDTLEMVVE